MYKSVYFKRSIADWLYLKKRLYTFQIYEYLKLKKHLDDFNKVMMDLKNNQVRTKDEDIVIILLSSLSKGINSL